METKTVMYAPRRMLIYLGKIAARSKPRSSLVIGKKNLRPHKKARLASRQSIYSDTETNLGDDQRNASKKCSTTRPCPSRLNHCPQKIRQIPIGLSISSLSRCRNKDSSDTAEDGIRGKDDGLTLNSITRFPSKSGIIILIKHIISDSPNCAADPESNGPTTGVAAGHGYGLTEPLRAHSGHRPNQQNHYEHHND